jgi:indolepyruvate ferredoxin oxidoreductase
MFQAFKVLAKLKFLRGSWADIFSYTVERRLERGLIDWYVETVEQLLATLSPDNFDQAVRIASLPEEIRGFGHVKQRAIEAVSAQWKESMVRYWELGQEPSVCPQETSS